MDLKQAAVLAYTQFKAKLQQSGYTLIVGTVGMRQHKTRQTEFCVFLMILA